ncbi:hypothetical protein [Micromonospora sp. NPDC000668]|uniref:hypothetical protein n=1 Tax=Micromonospora sp. NPDC000668 TaxID=3364219 RepID=UPI0036776C9A
MSAVLDEGFSLRIATGMMVVLVGVRPDPQTQTVSAGTGAGGDPAALAAPRA